MSDEIVLAKAAVIDRCLARVREETRPDDGGVRRLDDQTVQDAVVLNLMRACEAAIDLAMHVVADRSLGLPATSREAFSLLGEARLIDSGLRDRLERMVGFRNVAVHEYRRLDRAIVERVIEHGTKDLEAFVAAVIRS